MKVNLEHGAELSEGEPLSCGLAMSCPLSKLPPAWECNLPSRGGQGLGDNCCAESAQIGPTSQNHCLYFVYLPSLWFSLPLFHKKCQYLVAIFTTLWAPSLPPARSIARKAHKVSTYYGPTSQSLNHCPYFIYLPPFNFRCRSFTENVKNSISWQFLQLHGHLRYFPPRSRYPLLSTKNWGKFLWKIGTSKKSTWKFNWRYFLYLSAAVSRKIYIHLVAEMKQTRSSVSINLSHLHVSDLFQPKFLGEQI